MAHETQLLYSIQLFKKDVDGQVKEVGKVAEWYKQEKTLESSSTRVKKFTKEEADLKATTLSEMGYIVRIIEES